MTVAIHFLRIDQLHGELHGKFVTIWNAWISRRTHFLGFSGSWGPSQETIRSVGSAISTLWRSSLLTTGEALPRGVVTGSKPLSVGAAEERLLASRSSGLGEIGRLSWGRMTLLRSWCEYISFEDVSEQMATWFNIGAIGPDGTRLWDSGWVNTRGLTCAYSFHLNEWSPHLEHVTRSSCANWHAPKMLMESEAEYHSIKHLAGDMEALM